MHGAVIAVDAAMLIDRQTTVQRATPTAPAAKSVAAEPAKTAAVVDTFQAAAAATFGKVNDKGPGGAWYHKVESKPAAGTLGVKASVTVGRFVADPARAVVFDAAHPFGQPQDVMSNYIGTSGVAMVGKTRLTAEADVGFATNRVFDAKGRATFVTADQQAAGTRPSSTVYEKAEAFFDSVTDQPFTGDASTLVPHFASRAFVRTHEPVLVDGQPTFQANGKPVMKNTPMNLPKENQSQYAYQGESVTMSNVRKAPPSSGDNVTFAFEVTRADGQKANASLSWNSAVLGLKSATVSTKRITSIDQADGEKSGTKLTAATVSNARWNSVMVQQVNGKNPALVGPAATVVHGVDSNPKKTFTTGNVTVLGGETVNIAPR